MRQLHTRKRDGSGAKGLKTQHRRAAALDGAMVLLNDIVEIPAFTYHHRSQIGILFPQETQCAMTRCVAVEIYLLRWPKMVSLHSLSKEGSRSPNAAILA
jgi:hypothetical protein